MQGLASKQGAAWMWPLYLTTFVVTSLHVVVAPYTKVEESFSLHAVHDILRYGLLPGAVDQFDHVEFPGAVPRSFVPSLILAMLSYPFASLAVWAGVAKTSLHIQIIVRLVLAAVTSCSLNRLASAVARRFTVISGALFLALSLSQFHIPYYASRTLPNFMALPPVLYSFSLLIDSKTHLSNKKRDTLAIWLLTFTATVMRLELALFVVPLTLNLIIRGRLSFAAGLSAGAAGGFLGLAASVPLDSYLWRSWVWPEAYGVYFNIYQGKAAEWGIMPPHYYLTSGLPKVLTFSLPFTLLGMFIPAVRRTGLLGLFLPPTVGMIGGMSLIGHKEWRFLVYVVPVFNILASITAAHLWSRSSSPRVKAITRLAVLATIAANIAGTGLMTFISAKNYPGGDVEVVLASVVGGKTTPRIHFGAYPLMTGASLFTFTHASSPSSPSQWLPPAFPEPLMPLWEYLKTEDKTLESPEGAWRGNYEFAVSERWQAFERSGLWTTVQAISAFQRFSRRERPMIVLSPVIGVVKRLEDES